MQNLPNRNDKIYKEIESFEDYELINCIAYEMMIRNSKVQKLIEDFSKCKVLNSVDFLNIEKELKEKYFFPFSSRSIYDEDDNFEYSVLDGLYYDYPFIGENIKSNYHYNRQGRSLEYSEFSSNIRIGRNTGKPFNVTQNENYRKSTQNFKRPIIEPIKKFDNTIDLKLNLNQSKNELIAYISKIKNEYDKNNSIFKRPLEILNSKRFKTTTNPKAQKKPKSQVYADWFYIYDYWKYKKSKSETDKTIFVHLEVENNVPYKEDNIRKIRDTMIYFIDKVGYKELITGIKMTH